MSIKSFLKWIITRFYEIRYCKYITIGDSTVMRGIRVSGVGGRLIIGKNAYLRNCSFFFQGPNNLVEIGKGVKLNGVSFILRYGGNNVIKVGDYTTTGGDVCFEASEGCRIVIGEDCMFSHNIVVFTSDSHSILDDKGKRLNVAKDVVIGNHVWIGLNASILKGSIVPAGSIIAANSTYLQSSSKNENSVYAGNPAIEIKKCINWNRMLL